MTPEVPNMAGDIRSLDHRRYAHCIEASRHVRRDIDQDVLRAREFDVRRKFLPDGMAQIGAFGFLTAAEQRFISQIQGRTYASMQGLFERFTDEELRHQALFRRLEGMMAACMPAGYRFVPEPDAVASVVLSRSAWSVLALACLIELFTQAHYRQSIGPDAQIDPLWKDVFLFHWKEESQHAILDELEWQREDAKLDQAARDRAVGDLIVLFGAVDGILQAQARADAAYFAAACGRAVGAEERSRLSAGLLHAYRWQYILSGVQIPHFGALLCGMLNGEQYSRVAAALAPLFDSARVPAAGSLKHPVMLSQQPRFSIGDRP